MAKDLCISNSGSKILIINNIEIDEAAFQYNGILPIKIEPNDSIKIQIEFKHNETLLYQPCLKLTSNALPGGKIIYLNGEGAEASSTINFR